MNLLRERINFVRILLRWCQISLPPPYQIHTTCGELENQDVDALEKDPQPPPAKFPWSD